MIKNIFTLTLNDLAIAIKNKTIFLIFFIPLFVFFTLKLVDTKDAGFKIINLGIIKGEAYNPSMIKSISSADNVFHIINVENAEEGRSLVKDKKLDALLLKSEELLVLKKESPRTLSLIESFGAVQQASLGQKKWISNISSIQSSDVQKESLPTWILMLLLLVGFVIMPAQVAEEKEKKLLISLLQTPMKESEWLLAKIVTGMILIIASISMLHLMGQFKIGFNLSYIFLLILGSFCFSSYGVILGFLCRTQASARILGVIFYLPHLIPSALSDFSTKMDSIAPILPSYHFYEAVKGILFSQSKIYEYSLGSMYLLIIGLIALFLSHTLMKKRFLM